MKPSRRHFLKASGVSLALPWLNAFFPRSALAADAAKPVRRMVCICTPLGLHPSFFFPEKTGKDYESTPYLEVLKDFRSDYTVVSGLSHAGMSPGFAHQASASFLTGVQGAGRPGFRNAISLDQFAAEKIGGQTRSSPPWLCRAKVPAFRGLGPAAWCLLPRRRRRVFAKLFLDGKADEVKAQVTRLEDGRSILNDVRDQAKSLALRPRQRRSQQAR